MRLALVLTLCLAAPVLAASTLDKTPGIESPTPTRPGEADFFFSHDFAVDGPKLTNSPTFLLEFGIVNRLAIGVQYASSSDIGGRVNEVFPQLKLAALTQADSALLDLTLVGGYDTAARSADGSLILARRFAFVRLFAVARGFSDGYNVGGATFAGQLGLSLNLTPSLALTGDVGKVLAAHDLAAIQAFNDKLSWSAGIAFKLPHTPHSISFYATNVNTHTPQGTVRGGFEPWRFGFEFDVPFHNLARYLEIFSSKSTEPALEGKAAHPAAAASAKGPVVTVDITGNKYAPAELVVAPGTTVEWTNRDDVDHTATADDDSWDTGILSTGEKGSHTFDAPGRYPYYCTVHPFMKAVVVVK
jgi:plastocyanin